MPEPSSERHQLTIWDWPGHLAVWSWGRGPVLLLLHGPGGGAGDLAPLVDPLVATGYRVVAPDLPGHGDSDGDPHDSADAVAVITRLVGPIRATAGMADGLVDYRLTDSGPAALDRLLACLDDEVPTAKVA
ncbi:alpha/beta fold hydrolase [Inquilinus sp. CAU 1745]|uniref:alpha/beta fold hydrolase n=1 Tax=Inquilinus sp. CAU 1745 TaxID=3140369 RepID=UPI00325B7245